MIPIKNLYYMLAYAFQALQQGDYCRLATEEFDNTGDLCAAILCRGISEQVKRGLSREYVPQTEALSSLRGKIAITESVRTLSFLKSRMVCSYDLFSEDTELNRILKTTMLLLLQVNIDMKWKKELRALLAYFSSVSETDLRTVSWQRPYNRANQSYQLLISVCWMVWKDLLQTTSSGETRLRDFLGKERLSALYERFLLEYYRQEHPELRADAPHIPWIVDDGNCELLPVMRSDITLSRGSIILIIDAKFYAHITASRQDIDGKETVRSANLYQIFTYVKNREYALRDVPHQVSGMLLYARTDEDTLPDNTYQMSGNTIAVRTLDLSCPFPEIRSQLDAIADEFFA